MLRLWWLFTSFLWSTFYHCLVLYFLLIYYIFLLSPSLPLLLINCIIHLITFCILLFYSYYSLYIYLTFFYFIASLNYFLFPSFLLSCILDKALTWLMFLTNSYTFPLVFLSFGLVLLSFLLNFMYSYFLFYDLYSFCFYFLFYLNFLYLLFIFDLMTLILLLLLLLVSFLLVLLSKSVLMPISLSLFLTSFLFLKYLLNSCILELSFPHVTLLLYAYGKMIINDLLLILVLVIWTCCFIPFYLVISLLIMGLSLCLLHMGLLHLLYFTNLILFMNDLVLNIFLLYVGYPLLFLLLLSLLCYFIFLTLVFLLSLVDLLSFESLLTPWFDFLFLLFSFLLLWSLPLCILFSFSFEYTLDFLYSLPSFLMTFPLFHSFLIFSYSFCLFILYYFTDLSVKMCNTSQPYQYYFQNAGTSNCLDIMYLHDYIQFFLFLMISIVTYLFAFILYYFLFPNSFNRSFTSLVDSNHGSTIEIIWTVVPSLILVLIAIPSFQVLFLTEKTVTSLITIKCIGSQWYWTYQCNDTSFFRNFSYSFDSYMVPTDDLVIGQLRLLQTDNPLILPVHSNIRLLITSSDVIHSFSIPSLGIKVDAVPGRLNQTSINIFKPGVYYGACQEICGIQHAFMPIVLQATDYNTFFQHSFNLWCGSL